MGSAGPRSADPGRWAHHGPSHPAIAPSQLRYQPPAAALTEGCASDLWLACFLLNISELPSFVHAPTEARDVHRRQDRNDSRCFEWRAALSGFLSRDRGGRAVQLKAALCGHDFATQVQMLAPERGAGKGEPGADVHAAAAEGVRSGGGRLPYGEQIQRSFGGYDISNVVAHTGAAAEHAAGAMGASAYATGNDVVLGKGGTDLHTVAHEAAHVVQQRAGVSLSGGVGQAGDPYERHADAVADLVVQGKSAEGLLGQMAGGGGGGGVGTTVQRQEPGEATVPRIGRGDGARMRAERAAKEPVPPPRVISGMGNIDRIESAARGGERREISGLYFLVTYAILSNRTTAKNAFARSIGMSDVGTSRPPPGWHGRLRGFETSLSGAGEWQRAALRVCMGFREWNHWLELYDGSGAQSSLHTADRTRDPAALKLASTHLAHVLFVEDFLMKEELLRLVRHVRGEA